MKLQLIVNITYDAELSQLDFIRSRLEDIPQYIAGKGLFTGYSDVEVDTWDSEVKVLEYSA
jgi:hypothetical protein